MIEINMGREDALKFYDTAVKHSSNFERKGKTMPYTSSNGHMFSLLNKNGELGVRYAKEVQESYIKEWDTGLFYSYGAQMRGYVRVPDHILSDKIRLAAYLNEAHDYVNSLPPK